MLTTPDGLFTELDEHLTKHGITDPPVFVSVKPRPGAQVDNCSFEVGEMVKQHNGSAQYGWKIWLWSGVFYEAVPYCIWRTPDGALQDVTPNQDGETRIMFVPDNSIFFEDAPLPSIRYPISRAQAALEFLQAADAVAHRFAEISNSQQPGTPIHDRLFYSLLQRREEAEAALLCFLAKTDL